VSRCIRLPGSDRKYPALTGRSGTQRARCLRSRTTVGAWSSSPLSDLRITRLLLAICPVTARTVQGMARVWSGQAPAWPLVSDRSVRRGSAVKNRREEFSVCEKSSGWAVLEGGGADTYTQRAIPGARAIEGHVEGPCSRPRSRLATAGYAACGCGRSGLSPDFPAGLKTPCPGPVGARNGGIGPYGLRRMVRTCSLGGHGRILRTGLRQPSRRGLRSYLSTSGRTAQPHRDPKVGCLSRTAPSTVYPGWPGQRTPPRTGWPPALHQPPKTRDRCCLVMTRQHRLPSLP
jgi:hypothetical protein